MEVVLCSPFVLHGGHVSGAGSPRKRWATDSIARDCILEPYVVEHVPASKQRGRGFPSDADGKHVTHCPTTMPRSEFPAHALHEPTAPIRTAAPS